eukprot:gene55295-73853_t
MRRNRERYSFLRWASTALQGVHINPPGTGIMHTINLEQLATVVTTEQRDGDTWVVPDMMLGTDSHTPMVNGIGVLGWGVGGLEAQTVMFGLPTMLRIPDVVGVRLTGAMPPGTLATDLALTVTQRLRAIGVAGEFVEFFGPGVGTLTAGDRSVVANMAPEYGATTGFFAALATRMASRICSEAVSEPPGEFTRRTMAFTASVRAAIIRIDAGSAGKGVRALVATGDNRPFGLDHRDGRAGVLTLVPLAVGVVIELHRPCA